MRTVLVTGDLIWRHDLLRAACPNRGAGAHATKPFFRSCAAGAWHLADLVDAACSDVAAPALRPACEPASRDPGDVQLAAHAFVTWDLFPTPGASGDRVWRIRDLLGCQPAMNPPAPEFLEQSAAPDLVVIDDADLGFRDQPAHWHSAIQDPDGPPIVLVAEARLGEGALWEVVAAANAERTTLVTTLDALRRRDAAVSTDLSWDRTLGDLAREIAQESVAWWLRGLQRVVCLIPGVGVAWLVRKGSVFRLQRAVYHPVEQAGAWSDPRAGTTVTGARLLAAAVARHLLHPDTFPAVVAASRALVAARASQDHGAGRVGRDASSDAALAAFGACPDAAVVRAAFAPAAGDPREHVFLATVPGGSESGLTGRDPGAPRSLLADGVGGEAGALDVVAQDLVRRGRDIALSVVPRLQVGKLLTADREEIERLNELRRLILAYRNDPGDVRPLSLAVFGPPGSGKSFAIKQLVEALFSADRSELEFNLSQFDPAGPDLATAFHLVRDATIRGTLPLVFWDEFDSLDLQWIARFLAPMQDGAFRQGGVEHRFGKAIFVFAGGTCSDFRSFDRTEADESQRTPEQRTFHARKGPDFVSRLRGYLDVKGPNPTGSADGEYPIRRAILLRSVLQRLRPQWIDGSTKLASIRPGVLSAFLRVPRFRHGARSLESIVAMSASAGLETFGPDCLPSRELLRLHVDDVDAFLRLAGDGDVPGLSPEQVETFARGGHEGWRIEKERQVRDGTSPDVHNVDLRPWGALDGAGRRRNHDPVSRRWAFFHDRGFVLERQGGAADGPGRGLTDQDKADFCAFEHEIWLREKWVRGWTRLEEKRPALRGHPDMCPFKALEPDQQRLNAAILGGILDALRAKGWRIGKGE